MKRQTRGGWSAIKEILRGVTRRSFLSIRRFQKRGGFGGLLSRTAKGIRRGDPRTIFGCCAAVLLLGGLIWGVSSLSATAEGGAAASGARYAAAAGQDTNVVSLENALAQQQANASPPPTPVPTPTPMLFSKGYEGPEIAEIQQRLMDLGYMDNDEPT